MSVAVLIFKSFVKPHSRVVNGKTVMVMGYSDRRTKAVPDARQHDLFAAKPGPVIPKEIADLIAKGALFVVNHSGGKDSQAMLIKMLEYIPKSQMMVVHASLGDVEWTGALELAKKQAEDAGLPFVVARAEKTLLDMVEHRFATKPEVPSWPSTQFRQCTSDLKRGPIEREVRRYIKTSGHKLVVNAMGLRAQESRDRAKREVLTTNAKNSVAGRTWYDWLPVHGMQLDEVWSTIKNAGQEPHKAYAAGSQRLSCVFCIMGSKNDLALGAKHNPELFKRYVALEKKTGYTMHASRKGLDEIVASAESGRAA